MAFIWNKESIDAATRMWSTGSSAGKIAEFFGIGRGAVMGKLSRLGLTRDPNKVTTDKLVRGAAKRAAPPPPRPVLPVPEPKHLTFIELQPGQCKWPHGDNAPYTFCGHDRMDPLSIHRPYCAYHVLEATLDRSV